MNEKQQFLEKLRAALLDRDVSESDIQPYIERFDRFYDRMANDPESVQDGLLDDIDRIADNIAEQVSERYDEINRLAERTFPNVFRRAAPLTSPPDKQTARRRPAPLINAEEQPVP